MIEGFLEPAMIEAQTLLADRPYNMYFWSGKNRKEPQLLSVDSQKRYSRDQLNSKFESSMSRKSRREYFKPLLDDDIKDVKYVLLNLR